MPMTVNGIGTSYFGKKNLVSRADVCQHCGAQTQLASYDTWYVFVVIFIPIVPLARKRIIDQCQSCRQHWVMPLKQWEKNRDESIAESALQYQAEPTAAKAAELHASMLRYHQFGDAEAFQRMALQGHLNDAELRIDLAQQLDATGRSDQAGELYEQALRIKPDAPQAKIGVALRQIARGQLAEAHELLRFLEAPDAGEKHDLSALEVLARGYDKAGRPDEALRLCELVLNGWPQTQQNAQFRAYVTQLELKSGRSVPGLPPAPKVKFSFSASKWGWKHTAVVSVIAFVALVATLAYNDYQRRHRRLLVLNAYGEPAMVSIDGGPSLPVINNWIFEVPEGAHRVTWQGPSSGEASVVVESGYFSRFTRKPVWVVNVDGLAPLVEETVIYAVHPVPSSGQYEVGKVVSHYEHVDFLFDAAPQSMEIPNSSSRVEKKRLFVNSLSPTDLMQVLASNTGVEPAFKYAESLLKRRPCDEMLLDYYTFFGQNPANRDRIFEYLREGLWREPISVAWHRAYADMISTSEDASELRNAYDQLLVKDPRSAVALYLRGRIATDQREAAEYYQKSIDVDERFAWSWYGLAWHAAMQGDWATASQRLSKANEYGLRRPPMVAARKVVAMALNQGAAIESELNALSNSNNVPESLFGIMELCDLLAGMNRVNDVRNRWQLWSARVQPGPNAQRNLGHVVSYLCQDFSPADLSVESDQISADIKLHHLVALGRTPDASVPAITDSLSDPFDFLSLAVSAYFDGDREQGDAFVERAARVMDEKGENERAAAQLLRSAAPPKIEDLTKFTLRLGDHALLVTTLGMKYPERRGEFHLFARKLNVTRFHPYALIDRVTKAESN